MGSANTTHQKKSRNWPLRDSPPLARRRCPQPDMCQSQPPAYTPLPVSAPPAPPVRELPNITRGNIRQLGEEQLQQMKTDPEVIEFVTDILQKTVQHAAAGATHMYVTNKFYNLPVKLAAVVQLLKDRDFDVLLGRTQQGIFVKWGAAKVST